MSVLTYPTCAEQVVDAKRVGKRGHELWLLRVPADMKAVLPRSRPQTWCCCGCDHRRRCPPRPLARLLQLPPAAPGRRFPSY